MQRRFSYALTAGLLCSGAPDNISGTRLARPLLSALFGYVLGRQVDDLAELSETDPLTRLLNARGFSTHLHIEIKRAKRYGEPLSLLFLDVDGLKDINDRYGHRAGSEALREVASVIRAELRETDTGARWGGDEFTILAPRTDTDKATAFAERIRAAIEQHGTPWPITVSIGIATLDDAEDGPANAPHLIRDADLGMYEAKRRGKNTVVAVQQNAATEAAPFCFA